MEYFDWFNNITVIANPKPYYFAANNWYLVTCCKIRKYNHSCSNLFFANFKTFIAIVFSVKNNLAHKYCNHTLQMAFADSHSITITALNFLF